MYSVYEHLFISKMTILIQDRELHNIKDLASQSHIHQIWDLEIMLHIRLQNFKGQVPQHHIPPIIHHIQDLENLLENLFHINMPIKGI